MRKVYELSLFKLKCVQSACSVVAALDYLHIINEAQFRRGSQAAVTQCA